MASEKFYFSEAEEETAKRLLWAMSLTFSLLKTYNLRATKSIYLWAWALLTWIVRKSRGLLESLNKNPKTDQSKINPSMNFLLQKDHLIVETKVTSITIIKV